jgi:hypothetical protein
MKAFLITGFIILLLYCFPANSLHCGIYGQTGKNAALYFDPAQGEVSAKRRAFKDELRIKGDIGAFTCAARYVSS